MQSALDELQNTLKTAENYLNGSERSVPSVRFHIKALQQDIDLLVSVATCSGQLHQKPVKPIIKARRIERQLERLLIELEKPSGSAVSRSKRQTPKSKSSGEKLEKFDGDATEYPAYRNYLVEDVLARNDWLSSAASKWSDFQLSLNGTPLLLISKFPKTLETLDVALQLFDDVYGYGEVHVKKLYRELHHLPPASTATESIRMTHANLEGILLSLTHLNHSVNDNHWIRSAYIGKFPSTVIGGVVDTKIATLQTIRDGIAQLLFARESLRI